MILIGGGKTKSLKESLKSLEADIQHANTMALGIPKGKEGACLQMRLAFSSVSHVFLCLFSWADCNLVGALGLLHILIYKVLKDGTTTMSIHERKASLREFYGYILPSLQVLDGGLTESQVTEQKSFCIEKYKKRPSEEAHPKSQTELERELECGICLETVSKVVLPGCSHSMCLQCYRDWRLRSLSCPFCRVSLKRVNSCDLWIYTDHTDVKDVSILTKENLERLLTYVEKLPLAVSSNLCDTKKKSLL